MVLLNYIECETNPVQTNSELFYLLNSDVGEQFIGSK